MVGAEQFAADGRVHAIGADHQIGPRLASVLEAEGGAPLVLVQPHAPRAEGDGVGLGGAHAFDQGLVQVVAMQGQIGRAIERHRHRADVEALPALAGVPQPDPLGFGGEGAGHHRRLQAQVEQHPRSIGAELNPGADLAQRRRLFVDLHVEAAPEQGQGAGQAADAGADDGDAARGLHPQRADRSSAAAIGAKRAAAASSQSSPTRISWRPVSRACVSTLARSAAS